MAWAFQACDASDISSFGSLLLKAWLLKDLDPSSRPTFLLARHVCMLVGAYREVCGV